MPYVTFWADKSASLRFLMNHAYYSKVQTLNVVLEPKNVDEDTLGAELHPSKDDATSLKSRWSATHSLCMTVRFEKEYKSAVM